MWMSNPTKKSCFPERKHPGILKWLRSFVFRRFRKAPRPAEGAASDVWSRQWLNKRTSKTSTWFFWGWVRAQFWSFKKVRSKYKMEYCQQTRPEARNPDTDMCFMKYWPQIHPLCNPETQSHACQWSDIKCIWKSNSCLKSRMRGVSQPCWERAFCCSWKLQPSNSSHWFLFKFKSCPKNTHTFGWSPGTWLSGIPFLSQNLGIKHYYLEGRPWKK